MFTVKIYEDSQWKTSSNHTSLEDAKQRLVWLKHISSPSRRPEHAAVFDRRGRAIVA